MPVVQQHRARSGAIRAASANDGLPSSELVYRRLLETATPQAGDWGLMIALGPGFAAEGALLRW